jgi:2-keto-3-deoxy-L-rhamnonate aldolase RhmA
MPIFHSRPVPIKAATEVANDATVIICMIETAEAVEMAECVARSAPRCVTDSRIREIAAVPGVTVLHIGTNDMCDR